MTLHDIPCPFRVHVAARCPHGRTNARTVGEKWEGVADKKRTFRTKVKACIYKKIWYLAAGTNIMFVGGWSTRLNSQYTSVIVLICTLDPYE